MNDKEKCVPDELTYLSNPPKNRCKNCGQYWVCGTNPPTCHQTAMEEEAGFEGSIIDAVREAANEAKRTIRANQTDLENQIESFELRLKDNELTKKMFTPPAMEKSWKEKTLSEIALEPLTDNTPWTPAPPTPERDEVRMECRRCGAPVFRKHWLTWITPECKDCIEKHKDDPRPTVTPERSGECRCGKETRNIGWSLFVISIQLLCISVLLGFILNK